MPAPDISDAKLAELVAKAKAATPGPYHWKAKDEDVADVGNRLIKNSDSPSILGEVYAKSLGHADAAYLAAVDPSTVLALAEEILRRRAEERLCPHGLYKDRCVKCGAEPLSAFIGAP